MNQTFCIYPNCGKEIPAGRVVHKCDDHIHLGRCVVRGRLYLVDSHIGGSYTAEYMGFYADRHYYVNRNEQYKAGPWRFTAEQVIDNVKETPAYANR